MVSLEMDVAETPFPGVPQAKTLTVHCFPWTTGLR